MNYCQGMHILHVNFSFFSPQTSPFHLQDSDVHLAIAAELLGVDRNQFKKWMCNRKIVTVQEVLIKPLNADEVTKISLHHYLSGPAVQRTENIMHWISH